MRQILLLSLLAVLVSSCVSSGIVRSGFQPAAIQPILFVTPVSIIGLIQQGNRPLPSEQASNESIQLMRSLLTSHQAKLHLTGELVIPDSLKSAAYQQIYQAVDGIAYRQRLEGGARLLVLDYLLESQPQRYVLITAVRGFTRTPGNYDGQLAKSIGIGLLTMGMMVPVATKAKSDIYVLIYDHQQKQIVYFNQTPTNAEREPLSKESVDKQLRKMLAKDFPTMAK